MWRTLVCLAALVSAITARFDRIGFVSDPVELLLQDSYSSLKNKDYQSLYPSKPIYRRQIRKRKYSSFPPTFFNSFGFGPTWSRRQAGLPYSDLLFSGR